MNLAERMEEEVLDKYKVEESKREALEWRRVRKNKKYRIRKWRKNFLFENISCSVCKVGRTSQRKKK